MSPTGSDSNAGTQAAPVRTIVKASQLAKPSTTIHVAAGTYTGSFTTSVSGTSSARIRYVSDTRWGAKIVPPSSGNTSAWINLGSYVDIEGFDIDGQSGPTWRNGIFDQGSSNIISNNQIHHIATNVGCDSNGGAGYTTATSSAGANLTVTSNVVHHMGYAGCNTIHGIYLTTSGTIKNNVVYQVGADAITLWHDAANINILNNTVFASGTGILVGGGDFYHTTTGADYVTVANNIIVNNSKIGIREYGTVGSHNVFANNLTYGNTTNWSLLNGHTHSGDVTADPQFVTYVADGGGDYRLKSTSPAIDKGSSTYTASTDITGMSRPQGAAPDIGAYEYVAQ